jgi:tripartite-type tricarboxylate transporter receptor subunit TctC
MPLTHDLRTIARRMALAAIASLTAMSAQAAYPERPITLIVPWAAGGGADSIARVYGSLLEQELKQPVNVVNRTGGGGVVGHTAIAQAQPDGYTIGIATMEITVFKALGMADITPASYRTIARIAEIPSGVTVAANSKYKDAKELLEAIKAAPKGTFKASGTGPGGSWHFAVGGWLKSMGVEPQKVAWVPSNGGAPALQDVVAGGIDMATCSVVEARSLLEAGRVRTLTVMAEKRLDQFPQVPTLKESFGSDWTMSTWFAVLGPKGMNEDAAQRLLAATKKVHESAQFKEFVAQRGYTPVWNEGKDFDEFAAKWERGLSELAGDLGLKR